MLSPVRSHESIFCRAKRSIEAGSTSSKRSGWFFSKTVSPMGSSKGENTSSAMPKAFILDCSKVKGTEFAIALLTKSGELTGMIVVDHVLLVDNIPKVDLNAGNWDSSAKACSHELYVSVAVLSTCGTKTVSEESSKLVGSVHELTERVGNSDLLQIEYGPRK